MVRSISVDEFSFAVEKLLDEKLKDVEKVTEKAVRAAGRVTVNQLKSTSPQLTGGYAAGWRAKYDSHRGDYHATIYNGAKPGLTHLLEFGHGKVLWGRRVGGRVGPRPHIEQAYNAGVKELLSQVGK